MGFGKSGAQAAPAPPPPPPPLPPVMASSTVKQAGAAQRAAAAAAGAGYADTLKTGPRGDRDAATAGKALLSGEK